MVFFCIFLIVPILMHFPFILFYTIPFIIILLIFFVALRCPE
jgi:hypothetical protein